MNSSSDTDSTANHLGTLATFIVESGAYYFGIGSNPADAEIVSVDKNSLELVPDADLVASETSNETIEENCLRTSEPDADPSGGGDQRAFERPGAAGAKKKKKNGAKGLRIHGETLIF